MMLKKIFATIAVSSAFVMPAAASADTPPPEGKVHVLKTITVYGHRQYPSVVIEIARMSAAHEAAAAHESLRSALLEASLPPGLRPQASR